MSTVQFYRIEELNCGHDSAEVTVASNVATVEFSGRDPTTVRIRFMYNDDLRRVGQALLDAAERMS